MAEVWYLDIEDIEREVYKEKEPQYKPDFKKCIEILELSPKRWKCGPDEIPQLRTGNPAIDTSGYLYVLVRANAGEIEKLEAGENEWKAGWYVSPLTMITVERKLRQPQQPPQSK